MSIQITHVRLSDADRSQDHEHITHVMWVNPETEQAGGSTKAEIVDWIDHKKGTTFVGSRGSRVPVGTIHPDGGTPYLRTYADGKWTNNLLELPRF